MIKTSIITVCLFVFGFGFGQNLKAKDSISNELSEVVVTGTKKTFINKNGNIKVDVANSIYNSIPNTIDLLSKLPNIQISSDREHLSVIGRGNPLIYIDNQKVGMNDLNTLSVDDIKTIEIINNPSSKYEAEGRAVILITRKFSKKEGFQMAFSEVASFKKAFNNYLGVNTSAKKKKLEIKTNFNYNQLNPWESHRINYEIPDQDIISNYLVATNPKKPKFIFGSGLFYKINEDDYFSFNVNSRMQKENFGISTHTYNKNGDTQNNVLTLSSNKDTRNFISSFINYSKKIKAIESQLFTGFQYSNFNQNTKSSVSNNYNNTQFELSQNRNQKFHVDVFSARADLEKTFKNGMKWEVGGLYLSAAAGTGFESFDFENNNTISSKYIFDEQNASVYVQFSGTVKKVGYSFGLRAENTLISGQFANDSAALINKNYTNFFPKVQFDIPIDSSKTLNVSYSKSISRPDYSSTSQNTGYINPYFIYSRNINLDPTISNEMAANFNYKDKSVRLRYYQNSNPVYSSFSYDDQQNIMTLKPINYEKESGFNIEFTLPFSYKSWSSTNSISSTINKIEDPTALYNESKPYLYVYSNHQLKVSDFTFLLTGWGLTQQKEGVFERNAIFIMDFALSKTVFKHWDWTLSCNDIFKNMIYTEKFKINAINSNSTYYSDVSELSISVKYSFGKIKDSSYKEKNIDENSNRIR
ncbi:outer membrane beta-barrel family protein [Flavobacterium sp. GT3R68]|uniref:outer membrane beta-barrel family protein n=1 Tax=Flavobacterium sp. GT3R68 TaxID=2594437 RepID=UPI000F879D53|nr:outer membrane beta-barrel family protein [Flavobacterium sp. GT3R68]RTY94915.1 TonB-dependent receptor [Flavobacterium sp. GSN2]TRW91719.1 TonB-dependent receptor [Flavobacterium sp. GT3R68]